MGPGKTRGQQTTVAVHAGEGGHGDSAGARAVCWAAERGKGGGGGVRADPNPGSPRSPLRLVTPAAAVAAGTLSMYVLYEQTCGGQPSPDRSGSRGHPWPSTSTMHGRVGRARGEARAAAGQDADGDARGGCQAMAATGRGGCRGCWAQVPAPCPSSSPRLAYFFLHYFAYPYGPLVLLAPLRATAKQGWMAVMCGRRAHGRVEPTTTLGIAPGAEVDLPRALSLPPGETGMWDHVGSRGEGEGARTRGRQPPLVVSGSPHPPLKTCEE